jgi:predicted extracellular nuclease
MDVRNATVGLLLLGIGGCGAAGERVEDSTSIAAIQGASHLSPLLGRRVTVEGVVTASLPQGFYLQDAAGDGNAATSDAIFVQADSSHVRAGHRVRLRATVAETPAGGSPAGLLVTSLMGTESLRVVGRGERLPPPAILGNGGLTIPAAIIAPGELPVDLRDTAQARRNRFTPSTDVLDFLESLEGMLVTVRRPVALGPSERRTGGRGDVFVHPDVGADHDHARTIAGGILLRSGPDNLGDQNADRIRIAFEPALLQAAVPALATGDRLADVTGVVDYAYGRGDGRLTIATYNVLNLSSDSSDERQRERLGEQLVRSLRSPEIVALQEIQDASGERDDGVVDGRPTLAALARSARRAGGPEYAFVEVAPRNGRPGGVPGGNIRNAFLFDPGRVRLLSHRSLTAAELRAAGARNPHAFVDSRDPLEAVFAVGGRRIVVINNHLTSRFGSTPVLGAVQPWEQAGESEREAQTRALHAYVAALLKRDADARIVVLGDMNTFEETDELASYLPGRPALLTNLIGRIPAAERYSYIFEGNSQVLDHVFISAALLRGAEIDVVHLNADFPAETPASDHDPVVARFRW